MTTGIVFAHGITVTGFDYANPLISNLHLELLPYVRPAVLQWAGPSGILDYISAWELLVKRPSPPWYRPIARFNAPFIRESHEAFWWTRSYERKGIHDRCMAYIKDRLMQELQEGSDQLVVVGHSLGSVVLVDALTAMIADTSIHKGQIKAIVTMGSPLSAWVDPQELAIICNKLVDGTKWVNVWDLNDPVASPINPVCPQIQDLEVRTGDIFTSHGGYWQSKEVAAIIHEFLKEEPHA